MELAKQCLDVGLFTNRIDEMRAFYGERLGLEFETMLPLGGGMRQYRYLAHRSVIKLNHSRNPLAPRIPGGYVGIVIAAAAAKAPEHLTDPDGNPVALVPLGYENMRGIGIQLGVTDADLFERFYREALDAELLGPGHFRLGETVLSFKADPAARRAAAMPSARIPIEVVSGMAALGIRYFTIQVRDCNAVHRQLTAASAPEAMAPINFGSLARICFVRDPDGNVIEISQRATDDRPLPIE
jgi:lactoylglutathione lyase